MGVGGGDAVLIDSTPATARPAAAVSLRPGPGRSGVLVAAASTAGLAFAFFAVALVTRVGGDLGLLRIDDLGQLGAATVAAAGALWAAVRANGRLRASWSWIAIATGMWALGQVIWCYYELVGHHATPFPSLADAGYLGFPVAAAMGLWLFPSVDDPGGRRRWLLDGAIVVSSLVAVSWATSLGAVVHSGGGNWFAFVVSMAYPVGDIFVLTMAIIAWCRQRTHHAALLLLSLAMTAMAVADSSFTYLTTTGRYATGDLTDIGWIGAFLLLAVAAVNSVRLTSESGPDLDADAPSAAIDVAAGATMMPYLPLLVATAVLGVRQLQGHALDGVEFIAMAVALTTVLLRQYVTVRENHHLVQAVAARETQLHRQAFYDQLTGLANRALFINRAEHALALHRRDLRAVSLLFCDLDDFKTVNDTFGHGAGDEVLVQAAARLGGILRPGDTLARLGGDEFAVLLEDGAEPAALGARLVHAMTEPFAIGDALLTVTVSVGLIELAAHDPTLSLDDLLARADVAMYAAKRAGKGRLACYGGRRAADARQAENHQMH